MGRDDGNWVGPDVSAAGIEAIIGGRITGDELRSSRGSRARPAV